MKILKLRFKNLNSLYGEWRIDFCDPEYQSQGLFAITGPTGAGKSTILDAICLALYGMTPRLGKITTNMNEIMSRRVSECFAEVTFQTRDGVYTCHWSQHRARRKVDGNLIQARHEISEAGSGKVLESKLKNVAATVEAKTGMDFTRFTRSILLAQGGFDTFLRSEPDQRAPILEQITGTEVYSDISIAVHERVRTELGVLQILQAECDGLKLLDESGVKQLKTEISNVMGTEESLRASLEKEREALAWLELKQALEKEVEQFKKQEKEVLAELDELQPDIERFLQSQKAMNLEGLYTILQEVRVQEEENATSLKAAEETRINVDHEFSTASEKLETVLDVRGKKKQAWVQGKETRIQVRKLDQDLMHLQEQITEKEEELTHKNSHISIAQESLTELSAKRDDVSSRLESIETKITNSRSGEKLVTELTGIIGQLKALNKQSIGVKSKSESLQLALEEVELKKIALADIRDRCDVLRIDAEQAVETVARGKTQLSTLLADRNLREYRQEYEHAITQKNLYQRIANLESERVKLEDGKPCPLCGALQHPYAEGNIPEITSLDEHIADIRKLLNTADAIRDKINKAETGMETAQALYQKSQDNLFRIEGELKQLQERVAILRNDLEAAETECWSMQVELTVLLANYDIEYDSNKSTGELENILTGKKDEWLALTKMRSDLQENLKSTTLKISQTRNEREAMNQEIEGLESKNKQRKIEYKSLSETRRSLFGNKDPDDEEARWELDKEKIDTEVASIRNERDSAGEKRSILAGEIEGLRKRACVLAGERQQKSQFFTEKCIENGFADESQFVKYRLSTEERKQIENSIREVEDRKSQVENLRRDREHRLVKESAKEITRDSIEHIRQKCAGIEKSVKKNGEELGALKQQLQADINAKAQFSKNREKIELQEREYAKWQKLHTLIGSADGKKYRNFAQGLTFEIMVSHANRQLKKMSDRYRLIHDDKKPLELNVIDLYQAGEIRSTRNLSGGEGFIVSLALALGLSGMASRKVRVDSLFLDEGFGTLDDESLETALTTLAGLNEENKLIGVISHVQLLKERIGTRIMVNPGNGGRSFLEGPGCSQPDS